MKRFTSMGIATILALVLSTTIGAAAALAASGGFIGDEYPASINGIPQGEHVLGFGASLVGCEGPVFETQLQAPATTLSSQTIEGRNCHMKGSTVPIAMNGCRLIFHPGEVSEGKSTGTFAIGPVGCGPITVTRPGNCVWEIGPQSGANLVAKYENIIDQERNAINISAQASQIVYGGTCGAGVDGTWTGTWKVTAKNSNGKVTGVKMAKFLGAYLAGEESSEKAQQPRVEATSYPKAITGSGEVASTFVTAAATISCGSSSYQAEVTGASASLPITVGYSECTAAGFPSLVSMNSCHYELGVLNVGPPYTGTIGVACSKEGDKIEFKVYLNKEFKTVLCTAKVGPQKGLGGASLSNVQKEAGGGIGINAEIKGVEYELVGSNCSGKAGMHTDGILTGKSTLLGI